MFYILPYTSVFFRCCSDVPNLLVYNFFSSMNVAFLTDTRTIFLTMFVGCQIVFVFLQTIFSEVSGG